MRAMALTRSTRSAVALVTAVLLLLCQIAFAAQACAHTSPPAPAEHPAAAPCHQSPAESGAPAQHVPAPTACEVSKAVPDVAKVPVFALSDLPAIVVVYEQLAMPARPVRGQDTVHAVCYSPPLSILHCRFLN